MARLSTLPFRTEVRSRNDPPGGISIIRPIGVAEIDRGRLVIIGAVIKVVDRRVGATVRDPAGAADREYADLGRDIGPTLVSPSDLR